MAQYFILYFVILFYLAITKRYSQRSGVLIPIILFFFLFFAFRVGFTPDYYNYEEYYNRCHFSSIDFDSPIEIGFQWLCQVLPSYRALIIIYTALFSVCIYIAMQYYIERRYWILAITILFLFSPFVLGNMSGMRSGIVTCLFFIAILLRTKFKMGYFIFSVGIMFIAFLFHRSAIALFPLIFFPKRPISNRIKYLVYIFAMLFIIVCSFFGDQLNRLALLISDDFFEGRYDMYSDNYALSRFSMYLILKVIIVSILLYITLKYTQIEKNVFKNFFIKNTAVLYFFLLAPQGIGLIARYQYYFAFPCIIGIPFILGGADRKTRIVYLLGLSFLALWNLFFLFRGGIEYYLDYKSVLF